MSNNREMAMVLETQPPIFKLDVDCFEELFDWLSLEDLHAFGQTCKRMQQVAGYFFRLKYSGAHVRCLKDGIYRSYVKINGFSDFIKNLDFRFSRSNGFLFPKSHEFKSLKKIGFSNMKIDVMTIACNKKFLAKVEIVEVYRCKFSVDFYDEFLRYCTNMKRFRVEEMGSKLGYNWLLQDYPSLEHLILNPDRDDSDHQINELTTFFKRNPNLQHFATRQDLLWANRHSFIASNIKLDTLSILHITNGNDEFRDMLIEFRERKVYKRLHLYTRDKYFHTLHQFVPASTVEKIAVGWLSLHVTSSPFVNLKELHLYSIPLGFDMDAFAGAFENIERIHFCTANSNQISAFIRRSRKLSYIAIKIAYNIKKNVINVAHLWNKEREKLASARKVTVYVDDAFFLEIKEATQNKNYRLIEVKRFDSHYWITDYLYY